MPVVFCYIIKLIKDDIKELNDQTYAKIQEKLNIKKEE
jgi:hypothetical protein